MNETSFRKRVGNNISYYRKINSLTQISLAEKINYSDKAVSKWERGESLPDIYVLYQMSQLFSCTVNDLIGQSDINEISEEKIDENAKKLQFRRIFVTALSVGLVWLVASVIYFITDLIINGINGLNNTQITLVFLYAVPSTFIVTLIFSKLWGRIWQQALSVSGILWSGVAALTVSFNVFHFASDSGIKILIAASIFQVMVILWYVMRKKVKE